MHNSPAAIAVWLVLPICGTWLLYLMASNLRRIRRERKVTK